MECSVNWPKTISENEKVKLNIKLGVFFTQNWGSLHAISVDFYSTRVGQSNLNTVSQRCDVFTAVEMY